MKRTEAEVRDAYPDLLEPEDSGLLWLAQILDAGYRMPAAPAGIREEPYALSSYPGAVSQAKTTRPSLRKTIRWVWSLPAVAFVALALLAVGVSLAVTSVTDLGKPVDIQTTNPYFPLSGFHRTRIQARGKPALIFIGTQADANSAAERWPAVKALAQFGTFSSVRPSTSDPDLAAFPSAIATFDWSHARYRSRYVRFVHTDLLNADLRPFQGLSALESRLFNHYSRAPVSHFRPDPNHARATVFSSPTGARQLPLIAIGDYVQTVSQLLQAVDFVQTEVLQPTNPTGQTKNVPYPFTAVRNALIRQQDPPASHLVQKVNAEANIITALICHADGKRPATVCRRSAIKSILKHVK